MYSFVILNQRNDAYAALNPKDHTGYFLRATVYLTAGRNAHAIKDLSTVLELKDDYHAARLQRGKLYLMDGSFDEGLNDLNAYKNQYPHDTTVNEHVIFFLFPLS